MKKRLYTIFALTLAMILGGCSKEDVSAVLEKEECSAYLTNKSKLDVTVSFFRYMDERKYVVKAGQESEIPDTERWGMMAHQHIAPEDSVVFLFSDGQRVVHRCMVEYDKNNAPIVSFQPTENNIFCVEEGNPPSWTYSTVRARHHRYDYTIYYDR